MNTKPIIEVSNLSKRYRISHKASYDTLRDSLVRAATKPFLRRRKETNSEDFWALRDVSFTVQPGERVGIIGRNGAGKSTLLKVLSQIVSPTEGEVKLRGRVASLLEVGTGFHPELTGRENIFLNGAILGMKQAEIKKKFDEIVAFAEIEKFLDTPVKRYSSGMYVRLAFAVAAHLEPEILVVDEVLAVGDAQFQKKCLGKMQEVGQSGRTIFFVSHNMAAIRTLCSRTLLLDKGAIIADGKPGKVIETYMHNVVSTAMEKLWDEKHAPRNSSTVLRSISIANSTKEGTAPLTTDDDIQITLGYTRNDAGGFTGMTIQLFDDMGTCIFSSINNQEKTWYGKSMPAGQYESRVTIPGKLLNAGRHTLHLIMFSNHFSDPLSLTDVLAFDVLDAPTVRGDFFGEFAGTIRPLFDWQTNRL